MLSSYEKNTYKRAMHDIINPLSVIYGSLYVIQLQHPEVLNYKYWSETMEDLEALKALLASYSYSSEPKSNT